MNDNSFGLLKDHLFALPAGKIVETTETAALWNLLADCWSSFEGSNAEGMQAYKLHDRMEDVDWNAPILTFTIERHGGTVMGSSRAELHEWTLDLDKQTAHCATARSRQVEPRAKALNVKPIADELAGLIADKCSDPRLKWLNELEVHVLIGKIIPADGPKETVAGQRKRLRAALTKNLNVLGWHEKKTPNVYEYLIDATEREQ